MLHPSSTEKLPLKKGEGYYINFCLWIGASILIIHGFIVKSYNHSLFIIYQNFISGIFLLGTAIYVRITKKIKTGVNIGLFVMFFYIR